jgi:hypothetical protein
MGFPPSPQSLLKHLREAATAAVNDLRAKGIRTDRENFYQDNCPGGHRHEYAHCDGITLKLQMDIR